MAEALMKVMMPTAWREELGISSAGTAAWAGGPASAYAVEVVWERGADLSNHEARQLTGELLEESDLIVAMEEKHRAAVLELDPGAQSKVILLGQLDREREPPDVADPIGGDRDTYVRTRDEIDQLLVRLIDYVADKFGLKR
jgi:protein-tyrosine phosphatase